MADEQSRLDRYVEAVSGFGSDISGPDYEQVARAAMELADAELRAQCSCRSSDPPAALRTYRCDKCDAKFTRTPNEAEALGEHHQRTRHDT